MFEIVGKIKLVYDVQQFASGFSKREFVVTTQADKFPQDLKFEVVKDKCGMLDQYSVGQEVKVNFDIRGNEYNGKYYVNLSCWKLQANGGGHGGGGRGYDPASQIPASNEFEPSPADLRSFGDVDDDPPF